MMSDDLVKSMSFEEKVKERVKDSIGDLLTDEDLNKILKR